MDCPRAAEGTCAPLQTLKQEHYADRPDITDEVVKTCETFGAFGAFSRFCAADLVLYTLNNPEGFPEQGEATDA